MSWIRSRDRTARRIAVVDDYRLPAGIRHRLTVTHGDLDAAAVALAADAARQWFRLAARHPRATLAMPSVIVGELWHEMTLDVRGYAEFCDAAFGRLLPAAPRAAATAGLAATLRLAQEDEGCRPEALPLLFRVDQELGVPGGRRYLADCGGRGQCHELPGAICLRHVAGVERARRRWPGLGGGPPMPDGAKEGGDFGGGAGFGP